MPTALATKLPTTTYRTAATTYRVVQTGDSISAMSYGYAAPGGVSTSGDKWLDLEYGRNAYTAGMAARASTASLWPLLWARSRPGGFVVVQDNALGVSDYGWQMLMRKIVNETPADRWLFGVLPGYLATVDAALAADCRRRAEIMVQEFQRRVRRLFVFLPQYMLENPSQFADGQHPNATAQTWIQARILEKTG